MITFNNIVERFKIFAENHFFIETFSFGSPDDVDLSKFTSFPLMHLVYTGATYDAGTKTYNLEVYILDVPADKTKKTDRQKEVVSDAEQCAEDIIADIKNGGNIFLFAQDYEVVNATTTPLEEETKNVLSGVLLDLSVAIPYEWDACNAPIDGVEPGGTEVTYARRGVLRMLTLDGTTDVTSVRTINVTNGTLTDDGDGVVTLDTGGVDTLAGLTDVDVTGVTDGQVLKYDDATGEWIPANDQSATSLGNLDDVSITTPADRESLIYDGDNWVNDNLSKADVGLANVDNTSDANKPVSTATQTALDAKADTSSVPTELNDLSDVTITGTPTGNQALIFDGTANVFKSLPNFTNRFEDEAENNKQAITPFAERVYTVKADGDGIFIDAESDTPTAGKVIKRKIYQKTGFLESGAVIGDFTLIHTFADDTAYSATESTFEGFRDGDTYGTPPFTLIQTWEEVTAAPSFTGLLNESYGSGAEAAYSTRRLNGLYSGDCMTIRRASDGTTQSIGFVGEEIDESAIETFCSGTTCTVQVWRDQSGNGNDAEQTTTGSQPTIYTGGQLVKDGGRLALDFDGSSDKMNAPNIQNNNDTSLAWIGRRNTTSAANNTISYHTGGQHAIYGDSADAYKIYDKGFAYGSGSGAVGTNQHYYFHNSNGTNYSFFVNGNSVYSGTRTLATGTNNLQIGSFLGSYLFNGTMQESIIWGSDKSTDRTDIEGNISAYFQSAKLLDESFGSGAEAAYSTRQLRRDQTDCMVIRRASDSTTQTIGFDGSGNIDEAAIETFCTGTTCTAYQWLDQSGNGNTATAGSGAEPTIYTGGAIVKENAKVAMRFALGDRFTTGVEVNLRAFFHVGKATAATRLRFIGSTTEWVRWWSATELRLQNQATMSLTGVNRLDYNLVFAANDTTSQLAINGGTATTATTLETDSIPLNISLNDSSGWQGTMQEMLIYESDKSTDRTSIESNIGDYFTQNTPLLDTYSGAAAAYSLRLLDSTYTGALVEVYNGSSYADIGANVFGELDTVALAAHCGSNDGFVSKWYDQSGNTNTVTQTATGAMPKIYDGTTGVVTENGKPAIYFVDGTKQLAKTSGWGGTNVNTCDIVNVHRRASGSGNPLFWYQASFQVANYGTPSYGLGWGNPTTGPAADTNQNIFYGKASNTVGQIFLNNVASTAGTLSGTRHFSGSFAFQGRPGFLTYTAPEIYQQEYIQWDSNQSDTDRTGIATNMATFYGITI